MADKVSVPHIIGLTKEAASDKLKSSGLVVGSVTTNVSSTLAVGSVAESTPAEGAVVESGSAVALELAGAQIVVPDITGLNVSEAKEALEQRGLSTGSVQTIANSKKPADTVVGSMPTTGTPVHPEMPVDIHTSSGTTVLGHEVLSWLFAAGGCAVMAALIVMIWPADGNFLRLIADKEIARGLITFLVALTTVSIALILCVSIIVMDETAESAAQFDRAKQVLSTMIGVLGTIVGFYFGSTADTKNHMVIATKSLKAATVNVEYDQVLERNGGVPPFKWKVEPALPDKLVLNPDSGEITGKATKPGKTMYTFVVTDSGSLPESAAEKLILEIQPTPTDAKAETKSEVVNK